MRIAVLGAGSWGTTLAILLAANSHDVILWAHREEHAQAMNEHRENRRLLPGIPMPSTITITSDLDLATSSRELIVAGVPAQFLRSVAGQLKPHNFRDVIFVNVAKGVEIGSLMTMSEVLIDVLPTVKSEHIVTLSGPSFADEVSRQIPTAVVAASSNLQTAKQVQGIFMAPQFRVYSSSDIRGVELSGSIKNVIAIGAGVGDGVGYGDNSKAAIMTRATAEIARLGAALGAQPQTFSGLSGIGDLIATCMSKHSRNRHVGEEIGKGRKLKDVLAEMIMVAEGVASTQSVFDLAKRHNVELPIVNEVHAILFEDKDPVIATSHLMTRGAKGEG